MGRWGECGGWGRGAQAYGYNLPGEHSMVPSNGHYTIDDDEELPGPEARVGKADAVEYF